MKATLRIEGAAVTGKFGDADVKGAFADGMLDLAFRFKSAEAGGGTLAIRESWKAQR